jgi:hypothetical protein
MGVFSGPLLPLHSPRCVCRKARGLCEAPPTRGSVREGWMGGGEKLDATSSTLLSSLFSFFYSAPRTPSFAPSGVVRARAEGTEETKVGLPPPAALKKRARGVHCASVRRAWRRCRKCK